MANSTEPGKPPEDAGSKSPEQFQEELEKAKNDTIEGGAVFGGKKKKVGEEILSVRIIVPSGQDEENYVGPVGAKDYIGPVPQGAKQKILKSLKAIGGTIKILGGGVYLSLENLIISQKAMRNIMNIEEGVEEKMIEEKESEPEFEQPKTIEKANELAKRYYLRGIGMKDSLEYLLPYLKFTEQFNPIAVVPKENFIDLVDNKDLKNLLKKTDLGDKIKENVQIDRDGLRTGGYDFSNEYIEQLLSHYAGDFRSADDKLFCVPNYASLAIFAPDDLRMKFVKFAQANNPNEKPYLVSIVPKGICRVYHIDKDSLVPTAEELNRFVEASGEKKITDLLEFLHTMDTKFSATAQIIGEGNPFVVNERVKTFVYKDILQENNPNLCYKEPDQKPPQHGSGRGIL